LFHLTRNLVAANSSRVGCIGQVLHTVREITHTGWAKKWYLY